MQISTDNPRRKEFSQRHKIVFLKYCLVLKKYGSLAPSLDKTLIWREIADALSYRNPDSVRKIVSAMLKRGYIIIGDVERGELIGIMNEMESLKDEVREQSTGHIN